MDKKANANNKIPQGALAFFWFISRQHLFWMLGAMLLVVLASSLSAGMSYFFKLIIDAVEAGDVDSAMFYGLMFPVAILVVQMLYRLSGMLGARWTVYSNKTAFDTLADYVLSHSHSYFANRFAGSVTNKFRNVTGAFDQIIPDFLWGQLNAVVSFVITFCLIAMVNIASALSFLLLLVFLVLVNNLMMPKKKDLVKDSAEAGTRQQGRLVDSLSNINLVNQFSKNDRELAELKELSSNKQKFALMSWLYTERILIANSFVLFFFGLLLFWFLIHDWSLGNVSTGEFVLVLALVSNITGTLLFVGRAFNSAARVMGELEEGLLDILVPYEITDIAGAKPIKVTGGEVVFENVDFNFDKQAVFSDFSLNITPGSRVGLVGSSGAGKSTFVSLLLRQYEVGSGRVMIDGQPINQVTQKSLREAIALVPQEPMLFHRTIRENIAYAKPEATDEEVIAAAKQAFAHEFIAALPSGYDTLVGERGVKLSGGQRQRVAIARALLKNAPILVLDEATSALDSESEVEIQKALHNLMVGKTVIAIAHRLSTLREMDRIIVLEGGKITEDGNHNELINGNGLYAKLWSHQAGGFLSSQN